MESPFKAEILKGKVALLTGGASGIGYEISVQLGKHGASIAVMGRRKNVIDSAVEALLSLGIPVILVALFLFNICCSVLYFVGFGFWVSSSVFCLVSSTVKNL